MDAADDRIVVGGSTMGTKKRINAENIKRNSGNYLIEDDTPPHSVRVATAINADFLFFISFACKYIKIN
jgi:hypothetical protein